MYKVNIRNTSTINKMDDIQTYSQCLFGISVSSPIYHNKDKIKSLIQWLSKNFNTTHFIIGDYLNRTTETIQYGMSTNDAIEKSLNIGDQIHANLELESAKYPSQKFIISHWKSVLDNNSSFKNVHDNLYHSFKTCETFRKSIYNVAFQFIEKHSSSANIKLDKNEAVEKSIQYIIEEMAVFSLYIEKGYVLQLYPGTTLPVLKELANGLHGEVNTNLKKGIYIDITIKKQ